MKKICVVTSTRADYGLLLGLLKEFRADARVDLRFVATGTHLKKFYGHTLDQIIQDGFSPIEIDVTLEGDRPSDVLRTMGDVLNKFSDYFENNKPDLLVLLGDRFEIFSVAQAGLVHNIPMAHIHGGEVTEGAIDDSFRHSITKMSSLHFTANEIYRKRVIQLGENSQRVFNVGAPGLDSIISLDLLNREELETSLGCKFTEKNILVTFHPVTVNENKTRDEVKSLFEALETLPSNVSLFITMPNADTYSKHIWDSIQSFLEKNSYRAYVFKSLGQLRYLSLMKEVDIVVGNSSSGIIEAPFMNKAVINIGERQNGRATSEHVISIPGNKIDIEKALEKALTQDFKDKLKTFTSIYGDGKSSPRIAKKILEQDYSDLLPKKFFDL